MQKVTLPNGLKVIHQPKKGNAVVVQVLVNVGSNDEAHDERGIAHFLEHLLFEGTTNRPSNLEISNAIEKVGGDFNAYTTNERTCFHIKVLKKHFALAVEILGDILQNSLFKKEHVEKEKNIVLKEIEMVNDEPRFYQWVLFQKNLFQKHPCKNPTYGDKKVIRNLTREKILPYFKKHYLPNNMVVCIVGDAPNWKRIIRNTFVMKKGTTQKKKLHLELTAHRQIVKKERKNVVNTYVILGFKTVPRNHPDSYVLEVINGILGRGQSGRMFHEIRGKRGLAYDVGTQHTAEGSFGYFAAYATIDRKNVNLVQSLILQELEKLKTISKHDLQEAQEYIEGEYLLELEDVQKTADQLLFWEQIKNAELMTNFIAKIKKVTTGEVKRVVEKYFKNQALVVLEGR